MSRGRRLEIYDPFCYTSSLSSIAAFPPFLLEDELDEHFDTALSLCHPYERRSIIFDDVADLFPVDAGLFCSYRRFRGSRLHPESYLFERLCDRVAALEERFDVMMLDSGPRDVERKCKWTAEIKDPAERKYKWVSEFETKKKKGDDKAKRSYKWTAEVKREGDDSRKYTFEVSSDEKGDDRKKHPAKPAKSISTRLVEIGETSSDRGTVALKQAFSKRAGSVRSIRGKNKELSPQDAALMIQISFKAYLVRRSRALRALRELAIAKSKLKEIRALFNNFSYRRQLLRDAEERQRFSEKIIVLLLTVDAIEGADVMVRSAKKSIIDELEAMLDVVDPQPSDKLLSLRRRKFDVPDGAIRQEIADGVAQVVQMLEDESK